MNSQIASGGWVIEVLSSELDYRRQRYLVAMSDRDQAVAMVLRFLGDDADITSAVPVSRDILEISKVAAGKLVLM
jgi:hypothetical protein